MKKLTYISFLTCILLTYSSMAQEFNGIDNSPMDMAYFPDNYAHDHGAEDKAIALITYGRPQKNGREIFGKIIPFGKIWRTGANESSEFIAYRDLQFGDQTLPMGAYSLFSIPNEQDWTIIFSKDVDTWGAYKYNEKNDVLRVNVPVGVSAMTIEAFSIRFENKDNNKGVMNIGWDTTKIEVPFQY